MRSGQAARCLTLGDGARVDVVLLAAILADTMRGGAAMWPLVLQRFLPVSRRRRPPERGGNALVQHGAASLPVEVNEQNRLLRTRGLAPGEPDPIAGLPTF